MMSLDERLGCFRSSLVALWPTLVDRAGIHPGDDDWDDVVELLFDVFVAQPIRDSSGSEIQGRHYETYSRPRGEPVHEIEFEVIGEGEVLVGRPSEEAADGHLTMPWAPEAVALGTVVEFRSFSHPFHADKMTLDFVTGEITSHDDMLAIGDCLVVPVRRCRFGLRRRRTSR